MADFLGVANSIEKLNNNNYGNWSTRIRYYLIGQDLWDIVGGDSITPPTGDAKARKEWEMKSGRAMFALMTAVEDEQVQRIRSAKTPKEAWDILKTAFAKKNEAKLRRLENELFSISQRELIPTLDELENILSNEETLDDKMSKAAMRDYEEEALFTSNRGRAAGNNHWRRRVEDGRDQWREREEDDREERRSQLGGAERRDGRSSESHQPRKFDGICYNCGKKGHLARNCQSENKPVESHAVITSGAFSDEEEWDMEALAILSDGELESQASARY